MSRSFFAIVLFSFMALAQAVALVKNEVDTVISVDILIPKKTTIWTVNSTRKVVWQPPPHGLYDPNATVKIFLGHLDHSGERLCLDSPLATNVPLSAGSAHITVPDVSSGTDYFVNVYGESGDISSTFKITGGSGRNQCP